MDFWSRCGPAVQRTGLTDELNKQVIKLEQDFPQPDNQLNISVTVCQKVEPIHSFLFLSAVSIILVLMFSDQVYDFFIFLFHHLLKQQYHTF